jgi:hypothetical protein
MLDSSPLSFRRWFNGPPGDPNLGLHSKSITPEIMATADIVANDNVSTSSATTTKGGNRVVGHYVDMLSLTDADRAAIAQFRTKSIYTSMAQRAITDIGRDELSTFISEYATYNTLSEHDLQSLVSKYPAWRQSDDERRAATKARWSRIQEEEAIRKRDLAAAAAAAKLARRQGRPGSGYGGTDNASYANTSRTGTYRYNNNNQGYPWMNKLIRNATPPSSTSSTSTSSFTGDARGSARSVKGGTTATVMQTDNGTVAAIPVPLQKRLRNSPPRPETTSDTFSFVRIPPKKN